jgi:TonB-dependent receptor
MLLVSTVQAADISGHLKDEADHRAVKGAKIELLELNRRVISGSDGQFQFRDVAPGSYTLRVSIDGKAGKFVDKPITVSPDNSDVVAEVTLSTSGTSGGGTLDAILVTAARPPLSTSATREFEAPNIIAMTTDTEIRQLPDVSAAEAVRRLPGVSAENDTGEARFINIRGLDADLNGTTLAGVRLLPTNPASPLGGGRAVAFDTIPAGLIGAATVTKTNVPEQDAEALGGTIELTPKRLGPDDPAFATARIGTGYEDLRGTKIGDFELSGGTRFSLFGSESMFSAVGTIAYYEDRRGIDDVEESYADNQPATPDKAFANLQHRWYQNGRKRLGLGGELAFEPNGHHRFYVDAYQTGYTETQFKDYLVINFLNGGQGATPVMGSPNLISDQVDTYERDLTDHEETLRARLASVGGRDEFSGSILDYRASFTDGSYQVTRDIGAGFVTASGLGVPITYDNITSPNFPTYTISGGPDRFDPAIYTLNSVGPSTEHDIDKEWSGVINWALPLNNWGSGEEFKTGISARFRDKVLRPNQIIFSSLPSVDLSTFVTDQFLTYYDNHYSIGPHFNPNAWEAFYNQNFGQANGLVEDPVSEALANAQSYQRDKEDVYALYGQYKVTFDTVGLLGGVRVEKTHASYFANILNSDTNTLTPNTAENNYTNVFPTLQARWEIATKFIMRGSISSAIARPGFQQVTSAISLSPSSNSISQGNPQLRPTTAYNFDWTLEKVFDNGSLVTLGLFDKELKNYIVADSTRIPVSELPQTPIYSGFPGPEVTVTGYTNISKARASGAEFTWEQKLTMLPGLLRGLGIGINYTYVDSRGDIGRGYSSELPSTAKHTANAELSYVYGPFELKLAGYYTSRVLFSPNLAVPSGAQDAYQDERKLLDLGTQYQFNKWAMFYFNVKNLTNDAMRYSEGRVDRPIQREFYGTTYQAGFTLTR